MAVGSHDRPMLPAGTRGNPSRLTGGMVVMRHFATAVLMMATMSACIGEPPSSAALPSGVAGSSATATLASAQPLRARAAHAATRLADGRVLIVGGCADDGCSTPDRPPSSEFYVPGVGFLPGPPMLHPRTGPDVAILRDGRILIVGGWSREGTGPLADAEIFDPATGAFHTAGALKEGRSGHTITLPDGRVLIAGGENGRGITADAELFDPDTGSFTTAPPMPHPRRAGATALLPDGTVLIAAGEDHTKRVLRSSVIFDPRANTWREGPTLARPRSKAAIAVWGDGHVMVLGGTSGSGSALLASTEILAPAASRFSPGPPMSTARYKFSVAFTPDGRLVVAGGSGVDVLAPDRRHFTAVTAGPGPVRWAATATALADGTVLVIGGYDQHTSVHPDAVMIRTTS